MGKSFSAGRRISNHAIPLGRELATGEPVNIGLDRLGEHIDVIGPTGCGKTQSVMLPLFKKLALMPEVSVVAMTCKGSFAAMCADFAIAHGLTDKLVVFNPGQAPLVGFNPLKRNGWPAERHAKIARTAMLAARGEHSLDDMPRLSKLLYLTLAVSVEQGLDLTEAARLLRPGRSPFRSGLIHAVESEFLRESLEWFDHLAASRQEEVASSSVSRLENFVGDPLIRAILTEQDRCLDVADVIRNRKKLCIDLGFYAPLIPDDARTMGRLILNTMLAHKFATPAHERTPTVLLIDEVQEFSTEDLAVALTLGREMKISVVMAHQFPTQLKLSAAESHLFEAVQECCRTKIIFGGVHVSELEPIVKEIMIGEYDWMRVKDERLTLECEPVESTRESTTQGWSIGHSLGFSTGSSTSTAHGLSHGTSKQWGASHAHSDALSLAHGSGQSSGTSSGMTNGETMLPSGEIISITSATEGASEINTAMTSESETSADSYGQFQAEGVQEGTSKTETSGTSTGFSKGINRSWNQSTTRSPFYEYIKRRVVSSRTFQTLDEFLTLSLQAIKALPKAHFVVKVPDHKAVFVRANFVRNPWIPDALRTRALQRMHQSLLPAPNDATPLPPAAPTYQLPAPAVELSKPPSPDEWGS